MAKIDIFKMKPPKFYEEGLVTYKEGLDSVPELIEYIEHGFTLEEAEKMELLMRIESMKYHLKHLEKEHAGDVDDLLKIKEYIQSQIEVYNEI